MGQDARRIEVVSRQLMTPYLGFNSTGAEVRAASAVDIALWDLAGKRAGAGPCGPGRRDAHGDPRVQHLCRVRLQQRLSAGGGRRAIEAADEMRGPYDDQIAFTRDAGLLAESLLAEGFTAMKIWPLDVHAAASRRTHDQPDDLKAGLEPFRKVRAAVAIASRSWRSCTACGAAMPPARICRALEDVGSSGPRIRSTR